MDYIKIVPKKYIKIPKKYKKCPLTQFFMRLNSLHQLYFLGVKRWGIFCIFYESLENSKSIKSF
jgi:hypothetical protein